MSSPLTISGLSSGIDTNSVITSTLALAAQPQTALKTQLNSLLNVDVAYQAINSAMAGLKSAADSLKTPATWQATTATSSSSSIVATGSTAALAGTSTTFSVTALAKAQTSTISLADAANAASSSAGVDITIGSHTTHINPASNSASDLVTAINAAAMGVKAALVTTSGGNKILQLAATSTGLSNAFTISGLTDGTPTTLTAAADASMTVGEQATDGTYGAGSYTVTSSSNTFVDAIPGVSFTASGLVTNANVSVSTNPTVATSAVQALVDAANKALFAISQYAGQGGVLQGDSLVNSLKQEVLSAVSGGSSTGKTYTLAGIDLNGDGSVLTFDSGVFADAFSADAQGTQALVGDLATSMSSVGDEASNTTTGSLTAVIASDATQETSLTTKISDWDDKLADQKVALTAKFAAMEAALSKLKSQSTFLTQAFAALTGNSSSSSSSSSS